MNDFRMSVGSMRGLISPPPPTIAQYPAPTTQANLPYGNVLSPSMYPPAPRPTDQVIIDNQEMLTSEASSKKFRLVISSADRNLSMYPNPASYTLSFDEPFSDVVSISLLSASIPLVAYEVNAWNNRLSFTTLDGPVEVVIPEGNYTPSEFAIELASLMSAATTTATFDVEYVPRRDIYRFISATPFKLHFDGGTVAYGPQELDEFGRLTSQGIEEYTAVAGEQSVSYRARSPARLLGFGPQNYSSIPDAANPTRHVLESVFRRDVSDTKTAIVYLSGTDINVSPNNTFNKSFMIVGPDLEESLPDRLITKNYNPPMPKMPKLTIRILNIYGDLYDFQNQDHRFEFLLTCSPRFQRRLKFTERAV